MIQNQPAAEIRAEGHRPVIADLAEVNGEPMLVSLGEGGEILRWRLPGGEPFGEPIKGWPSPHMRLVRDGANTYVVAGAYERHIAV